MLVWELVGAVIGAGFASGREIASFFTRYGSWSYVGIILAVITMACLSDARLPEDRERSQGGKLWRLLFSLLLIATAGAMLSGAGEVFSLVVPLHGAYWLGMFGTLVLAWLLARKTDGGLAGVSRLLIAVFTMLILLGFLLPPMQAVRLEDVCQPEAVVRGVTYGGFNAALQHPIMRNRSEYSSKERKRASLYAAILIFVLLLCGNAVLTRHSALQAEPMPFIRLMAGYGKAGYILGAVSLYLAILSTLTACLRGLGGQGLSVAAVAIIALFGFSGMVETVYPLLGGICLLVLAAAKFTNSFRISREDPTHPYC